MDTNLYEKRTNVLSQLTNTFHKGMDTDTSDVLLGSDQYRYAENLRITVDGSGTNGELHTIEGTERLEHVTELFDGEQVLAFSSIRDLCVAVLYDPTGYHDEEENKDVGTWRIVKWNDTVVNSEGAPKVITVFGPSNKPIWDGNEPTLKTLSTVLRWESEKNIKLYIANGMTELLSINLADTTYPFSVENHADTLSVDDVYEKAFQYQGDGLPLMRAELSTGSGSLKPAIVQYAYRLYIQNGAASDMSPLTKPIYLVKNAYEGYAQVETTSKAVDLRFPNTEVTGNLYIQIYRINYQQNGLLPVVDIIVDLPFVSEMSITDTGLSVQSVSAAEFLSELDTHIIPKMIESKGDILYAANIKDGMAETMESFLNFDARSYSTGNLYNAQPIFTKTSNVYTASTSFDNITNQEGLTHRQFVGHGIAEWNKLYWENITVGGVRYHADSMTFSREVIADNIENNIPLSLDIASILRSGQTLSDGEWDYTDKMFLIKINYSYKDGDNRVSDSTTIGTMCLPGEDIIPIIKERERDYLLDLQDILIESYTIIPTKDLIGDLNMVYDYYLVTNEELYNGVGKYIKWRYVTDDNDNPKYRAGEVYRFGIVLYDKHGKAAPVKWIADIMMPDYYREDGQTDESIFYNYHVGIEFFVDIPKSLKCSAYDIVRCDRGFDSRYTLFQGIVGFTTNQWDSETLCFNPGFFTMDKVVTTRTANIRFEHTNEIFTGYIAPVKKNSNGEVDKEFKVKENLLMFACPEYCYNHTQVLDLLNKYSSDLQVLIIDRRDVSSIYGYSNNAAKFVTSIYEGLSSVIDDSRPWVHSSALNILDNNPLRLTWAGLGFKYTPEYLELNAGFIGLQSRVDKYSDYSAEIDRLLEEGTWEQKYPVAQRESYDNDANRVCTFFNWFGQHEYPDNELNWHNNSSTILNNKSGALNVHSVSYGIENIAYVEARDYSQFLEKGDKFAISAFDQTNSVKTSTGNVGFVNWSLGSLTRDVLNEGDYLNHIGNMWDASKVGNRYLAYRKENGKNVGYAEDWCVDSNVSWYPIAGGDDLLLLGLKDDATRYDLSDTGGIPTSPRIYIANIKKAANPYEGYELSAINRSKFYSFGNYVNLTDYYTNEDDLTGTISTSIKIGGGDTFVSHFKYNAAHFWHNAVYNVQIAKMCTIYDTVVETDINLDAQYGYLYRTPNNGYTPGEYKIQHDAVQEAFGGYTQPNNSYMYNSGYSCRPNLIPKTPDNKTAGETDTYDTRIQYSNRKTNNESIDSWMDFKSNNFLDVDTRFGEITDLKLFKDKLMFWLNNATGIISTNERTILQNTDDASIILGDGSVLQRFDYVSQIYGQKPNQHTACTTNANLYWWDEYRKEILHYMEGYNVAPLTTVKMVKNYISNRTPVSVPTISYDVDNNEVICHVVYDDKIKDLSLVFNEVVQAFTAVYTFSPIFYAMCMDKLFMIGNDTLYEYGVKQDKITLFDEPSNPKVRFIINTASDYTKTFDIQVFGGKFYGGGEQEKIDVRNGIYDTNRTTDALSPLTFSYNTPLKQKASVNGKEAVTNAEYDFRLTIPRDGQNVDPKQNKFKFSEQWGNRLRGKIMQVELSSDSNSSDFALHYITTKYRISWI